ncbi:MAG TPA: four-carbon acid sugar kinase family protein, partial [Lacipirellulaceae bacterium]|nr:four-carbon acid sugar kinase family protein [Lacipirellulaceae bacterium]
MMHSSPTQTPPSLRRDPAASNATAAQLPELVLAYYGDDFSGSADVMEALSLSGINAVLFLEPPTGDVLSRFPGVRAVGVAGVSRSMGVAQMRRDLPPLFAELGKLNAPLIHYKICSTFDSSPHVGSIGLAMDLGREAFQTSLVPIVVGAPALGRFCAFGNLFARSGLDSPIYRLDRHPTMAHHPTTPMHESDLRLVLARETDSQIGLIDIETIGQGPDSVRTALARLSAEGFQAVLFDTTQKSHLPIIG